MILTNCRVVTRYEVFEGSVHVENGVIKAVDVGRCSLPEAIDLEGDLLLPGLIEVHTDNLEKHMVPRPKVLWPSPLAALLAHDTQVCGAGITTVFDAIFLGSDYQGGVRPKIVKSSIEAVQQARGLGVLRADHLLHLRCEVSEEGVMIYFEPYITDPSVKLVSLNDHTPGQRQWRDIESFRTYHQDKNFSDDDVAAIIASRREAQQRCAAPNRRRIIEICRGVDVPLASHDDTTVEDVLEAAAEGVTISEFPTTMEAASAANEKGLKIVAGAPNVLRGGSHSGNISALDLAKAGLLDALSSDYVPAGLLHAAFLLHTGLGFDLPEAIAKVTSNPAEMVRLNDRGQVAPGRRADLVRVRMCDDVPVVRSVWREGQRVS
jgi:alpha-D-ribose 1-methylphosphonate 5-triphosphate diphosphatase